MNTLLKSLIIAAVFGSCLEDITAGCINVDINKSNSPNFSGTAVAPDTGFVWNSFVAPAASTHSLTNLNDSQGNPTTASVTITRNDGQAIKTWDDSASSAGNPNPPGLMRDYLYQGPYTISFTNLDPGQYTLYVFAHGNSGTQNSTVTVNSSNGGASGTTSNSGNFRDILQSGAQGNTYLALDATVGSSGTLGFTSRYLNGLQLYRHVSPPVVPDGFAAAVTGGAGGPTYTVTTSADLVARANSTESCIIVISGTIDVIGAAGGDGKSVKLRSNKTLRGADGNATVVGCLDLSSGGVNNVIIHNLNITHPGTTIDPLTGKYSDGGDGISVWAATNIFITHCTFLDCADGACDITRGSDLITVSWCKFHYVTSQTHQFPMILGNTDESDYHVTLHHNWFAEGCDQRMPSGSYSHAHIYNNYFACAGNGYCTNVRTEGEFLVENNHYEGVNNACYKEQGGKMFLSGNNFNNCTGYAAGYDSTAGSVTGNDPVFIPTYSYTLDPAANIPALVPLYAGNISPQPVEATVTLSNLSQTFDGAAKTAAVVTIPAGLAVSISYDGSNAAPSAAGSYAVNATVTDPAYSGSATATLVIQKAAASVSIANLLQIEDGFPKSVGVTTLPGGLMVNVSYNGSTVAPTSPGNYLVEATVNDPNHSGQAADTLIIEAANSWHAWSLAHFTQEEIGSGNADSAADPDADSFTNFAEYALGTNPKSFTPPMTPVRDEGGLSITFARPAGLPGVLYTAESSSDLDVWNPLPLQVISPGDPETVRVQDPLTQGDPGRRFIRLSFATP